MARENESPIARRIESAFERALWSSRLVVLVAVIASLLVGFAMFFVATVDVFQILGHLTDYVNPSFSAEQRADFRTQTIAHVVEVIDGYLLATIMLIFGFGLYELFISRIDVAENDELATRVLLIKSLDDLKDRLAKVVLLILVVKFFEHALQMEFKSPLELLYLALGVLLIAGALYLGHKKH